MKRNGGHFFRLCALAVLAAVTAASGQDAITRVVPVASPGNAAPVQGLEPVGSGPSDQASGETTVMPASSATPTPVPTATPMPPAPEPAPIPQPPPPEVEPMPPQQENSPVPLPTPPSPYSVEIDLGKQRVYLLEDGDKIAEAPICSGRAGHLTPTGNFSVIEKDPNHFSNLYGSFVDKSSGRLVKSGADVAMPVPKGCKFVPAPMKWFMRFDGAAGMHAGILPGYPASHGCVRMPLAKAELFYKTVDLGTPVHVFGNTPVREIKEAPERSAGTPLSAARTSPTPKPRHWFW